VLKQILLFLFSTLALFSSPCTLDITPSTTELFCDDEALNLLIEYDQGANAKGKLIEITTATLSTEDIANRADYHTTSVGVSISHSTSPGQSKNNGAKPTIGLPQNVNKHATTHTAINENTTITITDKAHQTQDTSTISTDTEHASYTMTHINTEVRDIRSDISKDVAKDGFKAVGDYVMKQAAKGDKAWEDGGIKKVLAHAAVGAAVAGIGNGDAIGGALGAGAREAASGLSAGQSDATQQTASALIGAIAGGGTGASVALDGEKYNRQLHQREIEWIKKHIGDFSAITGLSPENARRLLTAAGMTLVDAKAALFNAANVQALLDQGFTKEQIAYAQKYLTSNTNGETFHNEFADRDEKLFTVQNPVEYLSGYDPNKHAAGQMAGLLIDEAAAAAAVKVVAKTGKVLYRIGSKYYTKLKNGKYLNVSSAGAKKAQETLIKIKENKGSPLEGYKGGRQFKNRENKLPQTDREGNPIIYKEYDVNPKPPKGTNRDSERIVRGSDGKDYYTSDHYETFTEIK